MLHTKACCNNIYKSEWQGCLHACLSAAGNSCVGLTGSIAGQGRAVAVWGSLAVLQGRAVAVWGSLAILHGRAVAVWGSLAMLHGRAYWLYCKAG